MSDHPYKSLPDQAFWRRAVADRPIAAVDPVVRTPDRIARTDKVATAGSCFARHIARRLRDAGYNHYVTEPAHPIVDPEKAEEYNYGVYTARFGNIDTSQQLVQLWRRAHGRFVPVDDAWPTEEGTFLDPYRPQIQPRGFATREELEVDRAKHLRCVREAFETLDVFVFTLGLTETWRNRADGAVYPVCPGVAGGRFDPAKHEFLNFSAGEILRDMLSFVDALKTVNRSARMILTVSPVPPVATATRNHVLTATTYSKSVLRVVCGEVVRHRPWVEYFPSYEIVTGNYSRGAYYAEDCRSVTEAGVSHVTDVFFRHYTEDGAPAAEPARDEAERGGSEAEPVTPARAGDAHTQAMAALVQVHCDETRLDAT